MAVFHNLTAIDSIPHQLTALQPHLENHEAHISSVAWG
jgi:hypothetical protein